MRLTIGHKLVLAFSTAVAILLATGVLFFRSTRELSSITRSVSRSQAILTALDGVERHAIEAEGLTRGYVLVADVGYRRQLAQSLEMARGHVATLGSLATGDSTLMVNRATLSGLIERRGRALEEVMSLRDSGGLVLASPLVSSSGSDSGQAAILRVVQSLRNRESDQLRRRSSGAQQAADRADIILRLGGFLVLILAPLAFLIVRNDFAVRRAAEVSVGESEARLRAATDGSLDAFYVLRAVRDGEGEVLDFEFVDLNARAESLLGHSRAEVLGQRLCELIPANRTLGYVEKYKQVMSTATVLEEEFEVQARDYQAAWIHHQVVPLEDGVAITSRDISERKRQEETLRALSLIDELTGLYNRRGFLTLAQQQLKQARRGHRELVLLFIDMDDFKEINDTFGHNEGDVALTRAAEILKHTFRDSDIMARLGGDEFVVLATDTGKSGSEVIINRLRRELRERNERDGFPYNLSFSVGAARFDPDAPPSIEELLAAADAMLYEQKKHKRLTTAGRG